MPRRISRSGSERTRNNDEDQEIVHSDGVIMGNPYSIGHSTYEMPPDFEFPKNLRDMTSAEREELYRRHIRHNRSINTSDVSPSEIINPDDPNSIPEPIPEPFDVGEEEYSMPDINMRMRQGMTPEEMIDIGEWYDPVRARILSKEEVINAKQRMESEKIEKRLSGMSRLEREAEERFGNI